MELVVGVPTSGVFDPLWALPCGQCSQYMNWYNCNLTVMIDDIRNDGLIDLRK